MKQPVTIFTLALGHGVNDFVAGYLLGNLLYWQLPVTQASLCFLVYNGLAFGGQYFAALWLSSVSNFSLVYIMVWLLNAAAIISFFCLPQLSFVLAGCASALYHVIGGTVAAQPQKASSIGLFAAPGIIGLAMAGYLAATGMNLWWLLFLLTLLFSVSGLFIPMYKPSDRKIETPSLAIDKHDRLMILLLTIITLRSALWNVFQLLHQHNYTWLLAIACSAFAGKILGGFISDRIGWRLYNLLSLCVSAPLVNFFKHDLVLFCVGVALLQSGIPASTALLLQSMKGEKEKGIGLSFGVAVFIAGIISVAMSAVDNSILLLIFFSLSILVSGYLMVIERKMIAPSNSFTFINRLLSPAKRIILKSR